MGLLSVRKIKEYVQKNKSNSQANGPTYLTFTAIPDIPSPGNGGPTARDANARALNYFNKYYGGVQLTGVPGSRGFSWDYVGNPLNGYDQYAPFSDPGNQEGLNVNTRNPGFLDFLLARLF